MSRHIDTDALKYYGSHIGDEYEDYFHETQWVYRSQIDNAPSIDIVFCKECKHRGICFGRLVQGTKVVQLNFCSCGEREDE